MLSVNDNRVGEFFELLDKPHSFKAGLDSCNVPGAVNFCKTLSSESLDTCEGGRFSCYIGADMTIVPCSFDQNKKYAVSLNENTIEQAWNSTGFENFRQKMRTDCPECPKRELCMGGCPLMPQIVLCEKIYNYRTAQR